MKQLTHLETARVANILLVCDWNRSVSMPVEGECRTTDRERKPVRAQRLTKDR